MTEDANPRLGIGDNKPPLGQSIAAEQGDFAAVTLAFLEEAYAQQPEIVTSLLAEATALMRDPVTGELKPITDDETKGKVASLIKRMRDCRKGLDAFHDKEKGPYLRGGQAVDQFFFGLIDKLERRDKKNRAGAADILNGELTAYDTRLLQAEQERRRQEAQRAEREAQAAREREAAAQRLAEEQRLAAERARKPEIVEQKKTAAEQSEQVASTAKVESALAQGQAEAAHIETLAKPADIMRRRGDDGTLSTMATEAYAAIEDETKLDRDKLWPFISFDAKEKALRAWAKNTGHNQQMAGASIGRRPKSVVR